MCTFKVSYILMHDILEAKCFEFTVQIPPLGAPRWGGNFLKGFDVNQSCDALNYGASPFYQMSLIQVL